MLVTGASDRHRRRGGQRLCGAGRRVAVHYKSSEAAAKAVADAIVKAGGEAILVQGDLGKPGEGRRIVEEAAAKLGRLDILVNNAGSLIRANALSRHRSTSSTTR